MGDISQTLRNTEVEVNAFANHGGEYSDDKNTALFKSSTVYKELKVAAPTSKSNFASATSRWYNNNVMKSLIAKVGSKYADKIRELAKQVSELNKQLTGSDVLAPKDDERVRHDNALELILTTLKKHRRLEKSNKKVSKMIEEKSIELFGDESDGSDDDSDAEEGTFNVEIAAQVKSLKDTQKTLVREQGVLLKDFYTKVSGGLYSSEEKIGTGQKLTMPNGKVGSSGKLYIAKMLYFVECQPQKFGFCSHEIRRTLKDFNKRKGTHYSAPDQSEVNEKLRERYITSNNALYKEFEVHVSTADFAAAHRPYSYGTNGGSSSDNWPCAEGDGLRILHFFVTRLVKVDCDHIESIEADLLDCPALFGVGDPHDAVEKVNAVLDEAERVDAQVSYRVILRICDVLSKRHPLFGGLHSEKLKPSAITERRNARPELIRLMTEISTILINIGENTAHWKANQVNVSSVVRTFHISSIADFQERKEPEREGSSVYRVQEKASGLKTKNEKAPDNKRKANAVTDNSKPICRYKDCNRPAFCHKKERGGELHGSKMCFDHFLFSVEDSKLQKPLGIPLKDGKTMVAKRGEDKKWEYKIFNVQVKVQDEIDLLRRKTFLKTIATADAEELLEQLHNEFEQSPDNKLEIYNTNIETEKGDEVVWKMFSEESTGSFELPELESIVKVFDIKRQKNDHANSIYHA